MLYILTTIDKVRYSLSESEKDQVLDAISAGEKSVALQGDLVPLHVTPSIIRADRWWAQENDRLNAVGKRRCKKCLSVLSFGDRCRCLPVEGGKQKDIFVASIKEVSQIAEKMKWPGLDKLDQAELEYEEKQKQKLEIPAQTIEESSFYIDPETGDKIYS